jgi:hypothetical protein
MSKPGDWAEACLKALEIGGFPPGIWDWFPVQRSIAATKARDRQKIARRFLTG